MRILQLFISIYILHVYYFLLLGTKDEVNNTIPSPDGIPVPKTKLEDKTDVVVS